MACSPRQDLFQEHLVKIGEWPEKHIYQIPPIETIPKGGATAEISGKKQISIFVSTLFCITNHSKF